MNTLHLLVRRGTFAYAGLVMLTGSLWATLPFTGSAEATETVSGTVVTVDTSINPTARVTTEDGKIDCPGDCSEAFTPGTAVVLHAAAVEGFDIYRWYVSGSGLDSCAESTDWTEQCTFTVPNDGNVAIKAKWKYKKIELSAKKTGTGTGRVWTNLVGLNCGTECSYSYFTIGETVHTFNAEPDSGSVFAGWETSGSVCYNKSGSTKVINPNPKCETTLSPLSKSSTVVARFDKAPAASAKPTTSPTPTPTKVLTPPKIKGIEFKDTKLSPDEKVTIQKDEKFKLTGTAGPNQKIKLYIFSEPKEYTVAADADGNWEHEVEGLPEGDHHIEAALIDPDTEAESERVQLLEFTVATAEKIAATTAAATPPTGGLPLAATAVISLVVIAAGAGSLFILHRRIKTKPMVAQGKTAAPELHADESADESLPEGFEDN